MLRLQITLVLLSGLLAGCGQVSVFGRTLGEKSPTSEEKSASTVTPASVATPQPQVVKSMTLVITPQATAKITGDARFNADALLAAIKTELKSRKVLDETDTHASATGEISLDGYSMLPTSNAIVFGNIISNGTLSGNLRVRDAQGNELQNRRIEAASRVSIPAKGESPNPLASLYGQFAVKTGNVLAGFAVKSSEPEFQPPR